MAQKAADNLYNQGLKLQSVMTVKSQKQAITKFTNAKKLYDSADKKTQCDNSIEVSRKIISDLSPKSKSSSGSSSKNGSSNSNSTEPEANLELSNSFFNLDLNSKILEIKVVTNQSSWDVSPVSASDGSSFLKVEKIGDNEIRITVPRNNSSLKREQRVLVNTAGIQKYITISQTGIPVSIDVNEKLLKFKKKGGSKKITVSCNSTIQYDENYDENWYVSSKPDWILVTINEKREKGFFSKIKDKGNELIHGKTVEDDEFSATIQSSITITVDPLPNFFSESVRKGEVVLKSGESAVTINISQQK